MNQFTNDANIHQGHRQRMRAKLFAHGQRIFDTYELLEMLLYATVPCKDTNPIAKRLLFAFGGLDGVLGASRKELLTVNGIGERTADFLTKVGYLSHIIGAEILSDEGNGVADYDSVGEHLVKYFEGKEKSEVVALFLDNSMRVISVKKLFDVDFDSGGVKPNTFIGEAVGCSASVIISAHNHPHGPFYPTQGDRATYSLITESLSSAGFIHAEHYIIMGEWYASLSSLKSFNLHLSQLPAVDRFIESREKSGGAAKKVSSVSTKSLIETNFGGGYNVHDLDFFADLLGYAIDDRSYGGAKALLQKYHTIENVFCASVRDLVSMVGESCAFYIKVMGYVLSRRETDKFVFKKQYSPAEVGDYLKALFIGESVEVTYLITYSKSGSVTGCHLLGEGTVSSSEIMPRKAIEIAVGSKAASVALAHNHPGGNTTASSDDINITRFFAGLFSNCGIDLRDHFIIAGQLCDTVAFNPGED